MTEELNSTEYEKFFSATSKLHDNTTLFVKHLNDLFNLLEFDVRMNYKNVNNFRNKKFASNFVCYTISEFLSIHYVTKFDINQIIYPKLFRYFLDILNEFLHEKIVNEVNLRT
jgi:hypothetical protein